MLNEMLSKEPAPILSGKKIFTITILTIALITITNAQGITNTLGGNTAADKFIVENSDSEAGLVVTGEGMVGIGTTSPWSKFEVRWNPSSNNINPMAVFESVGGTNSAAAIRVQNTSGNKYNFGITPPTTNAFAIAYNTNIGLASDLLRITPDGNVGIGTTNPLFQLSVGGDGSGDGGFYGAIPTIYGETSESAWGSGVYGFASNSGSSNSCGGYFSTAGDQGCAVYGRATNEGEPINIGGYFEAAGGNGRGVRGAALNEGNYTNYGGYFSAAGSTGRGVQAMATGSAGIGVHGFATGVNGKGVVGHGNVAVTSYDFDAVGPGVDYGATSSIRWKRNIVEIDNPLEKLAELRGVYFDWDEEHGGHHDVGMIAEEVGKVLPEIVVYEENGIDADGMDYSKLTPLLIEVAKAQQTLIEELTERINFLESK